MFDLGDLTLPVIVAPMAGGPTTPQLVVDAASVGGWGMLAAGNRTVDALADDVAAVRGAGVPVGVNLFTPDRRADRPQQHADLETLQAQLAPIAERFGVELGGPVWDDDAYPAKVSWLLAHPVDVVTFTFGLPSARDVAALKDVGSTLGAMVTSVADARAAGEAGMDFLVVQGVDAGGHQSTFDVETEPDRTALAALLPAVRSAVDVPLVAAGGIATPDDVRAALDGGAVAVQVGTAYLRSSSAGSSSTHRAALSSPDLTATELTRCFSGRYARGLVNRYVTAVTDAPAAYPEVNRMTAPLRKAAAAAADPQWTHLWAGTGWQRTAATAPAGLLDGDAGAITRWLAGA